MAKLCTYYFECLAREIEYEVDIWAANKYGRPSYVELDALPGSGDSPLASSGAQLLTSLVNGKRKNASRVAVLVGYPVYVSCVHLRDGGESYKLHPLFYSKVAGNNFYPLHLEELRPEPIVSSFARMLGESPFEALSEVRQLTEDLGIDGTEMTWDQFAEAFEQLPHLHSDWPWKEECAFEALDTYPPLTDVCEPGIYNRAIAWVTEEAPYTIGLREELDTLSKLEDSQVAGTALGYWLKSGAPSRSTVTPKALLEPLTLNVEQREAVRQAMNAPLTVVTGPPGTGKSQVLASIAVNAVYSNQSVLVASKNNGAVTVAIERVNRLANVPVVLRLGANEHFSQMQEALENLLGAPADRADVDSYNTAGRDYEAIVREWQSVRERIEQTIQTRNRVDELEKRCDARRTQVRPELFARWMREDGPDPADAGSLAHELAMLSCPWPPVFHWLWKMLRAAALPPLTARFNELSAQATFVGETAPDIGITWETLEVASRFLNQLQEQLKIAREVREYGLGLTGLLRLPRIEDGAKSLAVLEQQIAQTSEKLWRLWVATKPALSKGNARQELSRLLAVVRILAEPGYSRENYDARKRLVAQFKDLISYLPAWAVTNLSARGRIPLEPGIFDLVVIDESSQCDIASALPLLYRAKRAVIIGDPKQLSHISSINGDQETQLLDKYGLIDRPEWGYAKNSLYDKAAGLVDAESVVGLRDHHRSDASIISFSNREFYEGRLRVATRHDKLRRPTAEKTAFRWLDVAGTTERPPTGSARNDAEAEAIVAELRRLLVENAYDGSVGVVTPFRAQVERINDKIGRDSVLKQISFRAGVTVDTVDRFQGDERDVMLFSVVAAKGAPSSTFQFLKNQSNRLNVALTRARAMLIVVGDRSYLSQCSADKLVSLARYEPGNQTKTTAGSDTNTPYVSEWEETLREALFAKGINTVPQVPVEHYFLDLALMVGNRKLDIEVDGEAYHRAWDGERLTRDLLRDRRMLELGWDVMRFWVYEVRDQQSECVKRVQQWINAASKH